jgi:hypothetical protein
MMYNNVTTIPLRHKLMTKPVTNGVCSECGREYEVADPTEYLQYDLDTMAMLAAEAASIAQDPDALVPVQPLDWCPANDCPSNARDKALDFLYEVWLERRDLDTEESMVELVSPLAMATLLLEVWNKGLLTGYFQYELDERFAAEEEAT